MALYRRWNIELQKAALQVTLGNENPYQTVIIQPTKVEIYDDSVGIVRITCHDGAKYYTCRYNSKRPWYGYVKLLQQAESTGTKLEAAIISYVFIVEVEEPEK